MKGRKEKKVRERSPVWRENNSHLDSRALISCNSEQQAANRMKRAQQGAGGKENWGQERGRRKKNSEKREEQRVLKRGEKMFQGN